MPELHFGEVYPQTIIFNDIHVLSHLLIDRLIDLDIY